MQLSKNQLVVFEDGHKEGYLEARWSDLNNAFYSFTDDGKKIFSTTIVEKASKKKSKFVPSAKSCTVKITPCGETEKSYQVYDGADGRITRNKSYYKYIAKSICYTDEEGNIYAPTWA